MYSKRGAQNGVLGKATQKWVLRTGVLNKGTQEEQSKKRYSNTGIQKGYAKRVLNGAEKLIWVLAAVFAGYWRAVHGSPGHPSVWFMRHSTVEFSQGTHRVLTGYHATRAVDRTVRCAPPPGRGPTARSAAHVCGTTACTFKVGERHRTEGDLACDARRVLDGHSRAEYRVHRSAPVRQHCGFCLVTVLHCTCVRVHSADTRSDGHARADQRRRHPPAHARAELCQPDG